MEESVFYVLIELIAHAVNVTLRKFGYSEKKIKTIGNIVAWSFVFIFVTGLLYITIVFS